MMNKLRTSVFGLLVALGVFTATAASAETLMMPDRDGLMGTQIVVWGISTLPNGTAYTIDYGDGSSVLAGGVGDRSYINAVHTYAAQGVYTVTLTVGAETASAKLQIFDGSSMTADNLRSLRINMAIQDGLRYLWLSQNSRTNFDTSPTTSWGGDQFNSSWTSLVTLAFENHGYHVPNNDSAPAGIYEKYAVRRGLNYVISGLSTIGLGIQTHVRNAQTFNDDPCVGVASDTCTGLQRNPDNFHTSYETGVATLAIAGSAAMSRHNLEIGGYTNGKTYGEILQRLANTMAWGQIDSGVGRGGWYYYLNCGGCSSDGSTVGWGLLSLFDAQTAGAVVPQWVHDEYQFALNASLNSDGSYDYQSDGNPNQYTNTGIEKGGIGLQGLFFTGQTAPVDPGTHVASFPTGSQGASVVKYISDRWNLTTRLGFDYGWNCQYGSNPGINKGCAYSMFNAFKGLKLQGITTLPGVTRPAGPGSQPAGDWYADYQDWAVANQTAANTPGGGYWGAMTFSCCDNQTPANAAVVELILSPVALVLPDADKFSTVGLAPATGSAIEGSSHTVTATAQTTSGAPVPGATVHFVVLSGPNAGVNGDAGTDGTGQASFTYTDPLGNTGTDNIQASIGTLKSNIVTMTWNPRNRPPVANDDSASGNEDTVITGSVIGNDTDADGDTLTAILVSGPANGMLTLNGDGSFSYTPNANWNGTDTFTYKDNDGKVDGNTATVTITVIPVNDPPVAVNDTFSVNEDTLLTGSVATNDYDIDSPTLTYTVLSNVSHGTLTFNANGTFTYQGAPNYNGPDTFTYQVSDGQLTATATASITVIPVNDPPVCDNAAPSVSLLWSPNHQMVPITINGVTDVDSTNLTVTITSIAQDEPTNGTGDGDTPVDGGGIGTSTALVRAERMGNPKNPGDGRVYHINFSVDDGSGGTCTGKVQVGVPHDQSPQRRVPVDEGSLYNSVTGARLQ